MKVLNRTYGHAQEKSSLKTKIYHKNQDAMLIGLNWLRMETSNWALWTSRCHEKWVMSKQTE